MPFTKTLRLISNVQLSRVPLYLAAGPSTELSTANADTAEWLCNRLAPHGEHELQLLELRQGSRKQLDVGILLKAEGSGLPGEVTEVLLYAEAQSHEGSLPIPRNHTSLSPHKTVSDPPPPPSALLKVYALPLCSEVIAEANLATKEAISDLSRPASSSNKRKTLSDIFEGAALQRRKSNARGGEHVSRVLSNVEQNAKQRELGSQPREIVDNSNSLHTSLSRASSVTVDSNVAGTPQLPHGARTQGSRSSLHHIESALSPHDTSPTSKDDGNYSEQNKAALAKVVMAGMRVHGLQQRKKRAVQSDQLSNTKQQLKISTSDMPEDGADEYKLIYHQTIKAATFAFRRQLSTLLLGQETMRDVVDRLLELFCSTNPAVYDGNWSRQASEAVVQGNADGFDLPSSGDCVRINFQNVLYAHHKKASMNEIGCISINPVSFEILVDKSMFRC